MIGVALFAGRSVITLRLLGLAPPDGSTALVALRIGAQIIQSFGLGAALITIMSCLADVADEHELRCGRRSEGILYSARQFFGKAVQALSSAAAGAFMTFIEFPVHAVPGEVPQSQLVALALYDGPLMLLMAALCVFFYARYDLSQDMQAEISQKLVRLRRERSRGKLEPELV